MSKSSKMSNIINYRLRVTLSDARVLTGQMLAFDKYMNLVLADCEEFRKIKSKSSNNKKNTSDTKEQDMKRTLGLVILRGETIVSISIDGPPPPSADDARGRMAMMGGPGMGRPAGRGLPAAPPPGMPMAGLSGPVRGVGGPAPGMMAPRPGYGAPPVQYGRPPMPGAPGAPPPGFRPGPPQNFRPPPPGFRPPPPGMPPQGFPPAGRGFNRPPPPPPGYGRPPQ